MGISIAQPGAVDSASGAAAAVSISTALQAQVQSAQATDIEALFSSLGLGAHTSSSA